jgi:ATP-dependent DNA ligase
LPFDDANSVFELKYDGLRCLAKIDRRPELVSLNGHPFASFAELAKQIAEHLPPNSVLDGEIVAVDRRGRPYLTAAERELCISGVCGPCWSLLCPSDPLAYN